MARDLGQDVSMLMRFAVNLRRQAHEADVLAVTTPVAPRAPALPFAAKATEYRDLADAIEHVVGAAARRPGA